MLTRTEIIDALQFSSLNSLTTPPNTTTAPAYVFTYQYAGTSRPGDLPTSTSFTGWTDFTAAEKLSFEAALAQIKTFLNVDFVEVTGEADPDMNVGAVDIPGPTAGFGGYTFSTSGGAVLSYDNFVLFDNTIDLTGEPNLLLHEIGHALGLKHPFEGSPVLPAGMDNNKYTVMSYTANPDNSLDSDAMMLYDILALQDLWGATTANNAGATTYTGSRTATVDAVWDTGGKDTFDASARTNAVTLDLREGKFSKFGSYDDVVVAYDTKIENAKGGSGNDRIFGNDLNNKLIGGGGRDKIKGFAGADSLLGGKGNDKLFGGGGKDVIKGGGGRDKLYGEKGNDKLFGGGGADTFVFGDRDGKDIIRDFLDNTDTLQFSRADVTSVADATALATESSGGDVIFNFTDGSKLTVRNITLVDLTDDISIA
jgi:serralysin